MLKHVFVLLVLAVCGGAQAVTLVYNADFSGPARAGVQPAGLGGGRHVRADGRGKRDRGGSDRQWRQRPAPQFFAYV